ncbi:MAG: hypothetical protein K2Q28_01205 [Hyphomicrobium sp.]|nr:hypothetical protein [Hyphomicrobium sp.]
MLRLMVYPLVFAVLWAAPALADAPADDKATLSSTKIDLTPEEAAEREGRRACKAAFCAAFHNPANGQNVACAVKKSFRKEQLQKIVSKAKVSWPWGRVVCNTDLKADRDVLSKALTTDNQVVKFAPHKVTCIIDHEGEAPSKITAEMTPEVTFEKGKATKAVMNWGKVEGPTLVKGMMWTATATDNTVNVLGSMIVDDMNDFVTAKCEEVKLDWQGK